MKSFDAIIIGFGKGGKTLAGALAQHGVKVAVVEKSTKMYGGTCVNVGCIPSKFLIIAAAQASAEKFSDWDKKATFYRQAVAEKNQLTETLRHKNYAKLADNPNIEVIDGTATFVSSTEVEVAGDDGIEILKAPKIYINSGASSFVPPILGIDNPRVYTSESLMDLSELPRHLVIIGGGYIGLEFASMYKAFGSEVTVLQDLDTFLPREDEDIAEAVLDSLQSDGINFEFGVTVEALQATNHGNLVKYKNHDGRDMSLEADAVLVATGRRVNAAALRPENAGVELTKFGAVKVGEHLQTKAPNIYALGDVTGGLQFTYISLDDYRVIVSELFSDGSYTTAKRQNVPYSVFITPSYSRVGLNEKEAKEKGYNIKIGLLPVRAIPKAKILRQTKGLLKAVINADNDQILGAMLFCEQSYEVINTIVTAMNADLPYTVLKSQIFTHPTMSEALNDLFNIS